MAVTVELFGGPLDGTTVRVAEPPPDLRFPQALPEHDTWVRRDTDPPPMPSLAYVVYRRLGLGRRGTRWIYTYDRTVTVGA